LKSAGKILIVDDSQESLNLLLAILTEEGYDPRPADSGDLALAAVRISPPDLVLLDLRMPGKGGLEVCRKLKSCPESRDIPIIVLSASDEFADRLQSLESGAVDFISKPFQREELLTRLRTHLELARLRKDLEHLVVVRTSELQVANNQLKSELKARRQIEAVLRESEQVFQSIADNLPAGVTLFNQDGLLTFASKWILSFCGCTMEQFSGDGWLGFVHPDDIARLDEEVAAAVQERRSSQIEYRVRRKDGKYRWIAVTANPRHLNSGFIGHIVLLLDITELKRGQERTLASQKLESLGVLAGGIAQNFNNLLSTILAHAELALYEIPSETPAHESISTVAAIALRASEIVNRLMAYAGNGESGDPEPVELSRLIRKMVHLLKMSLSETTSLEINLADDLPPVAADAGQIREVVLNLAVNAFEALDGRSGTVTVSTANTLGERGSAESRPPGLGEGNYVLLEVSDNGNGMTEEVKARIFDPFYSTKFLGRGLGLASVQGIVRRAGGAISIVSAPGQGSKFQVWLPCWDTSGEGESAPTKD
jgi:PAS domain S-box-containing protein